MLLLLFLTVLLMLTVSFVSSLTEAVLLSLNPLNLRLDKDKGGKGKKDAEHWHQFKNHVERPISAILTLNTLANTGLAALSGALFQHLFGGHHLWWFTLSLSIVVLFGSELIPKVIAVRRADTLAPKVLPILMVMMKICRPVVYLMELVGKSLEHRFKKDGPKNHQHINDIVALVQTARAENALHDQEEIILLHAATLSARRVRSAMIPIHEAHVLRRGWSLKEVLDRECLEFRRYPISDSGRLQDATEYVKLADIVLALTAGDHWANRTRKAIRIGQDETLTQLLAKFFTEGEKSALVLDDKGVVVGWITLDDVTDVLLGTRRSRDCLVA